MIDRGEQWISGNDNQAKATAETARIVLAARMERWTEWTTKEKVQPRHPREMREEIYYSIKVKLTDSLECKKRKVICMIPT
jgi:hypothetical protein